MGIEWSTESARYILYIHKDLSPEYDGMLQARRWIDMMVNGYPHLYKDVHANVRTNAYEHLLILREAVEENEEPTQIEILRGYVKECVRQGYLSVKE